MAESISFKANPQFITELRNVTGDSIVRYILGHSESLLMMRMLSHREIGSSNQAKIFCSQIAQIFLRPTEERVFEMISTEKNKQENEQDYQFRKMKKNKKQKLIKQGQDSNSNQNTESKKKPKIVLSSQSIAELCAYSIRLALYFGFASFVYIASLSDEIVLINYGRHLFNPDSVSVTVPFLVPRLERIFIISLLPMALCGVGESIVRAVVNGKLLLISNTIMASLSAIYIFAVGFGISLGQILDDSSNGKKFGFGALIEAGKMLIEALFGKGLHLKQRTTGSEVHFSGAIYVAKLTILNFIVRFSKAGPGVILLPPKLEIVYLASVGFFFLIYLLLMQFSYDHGSKDGIQVHPLLTFPNLIQPLCFLSSQSAGTLPIAPPYGRSHSYDSHSRYDAKFSVNPDIFTSPLD
ncbi:MAG: hypothetical protein EZS28_017654 [Streblomastix strix]|uniref:Uncharacterized protein n=1 Tax=Streblomastix strix TaxID=222440 RepID=A0A5J4VWH5_9EUKA|nr:MAG: hypothetical protein EZS28_017654 [Streblomastix strix]